MFCQICGYSLSFLFKKNNNTILSRLNNVKLKSFCRKIFSRTVHRKELMY